MDNFSNLLNRATKKGFVADASSANIDASQYGSLSETDRNIKRASSILSKASQESERAFNKALNSYFKKLGLKYKNGTITAPAVDKAINNMASKAKSNGVSTGTITALITAMAKRNENAKSSSSTSSPVIEAFPGSTIKSPNPIFPGSSGPLNPDNPFDIRNILKK